MHASTKAISILLTEHSDRFSRLFRTVAGCEYTHASIGIEGHNRKFFSFLTKVGFCIERPILSAKGKNGHASCALYRLDVSEEVFTDISLRLQEFIKHARQYSFSFLGAVLCCLRVPHHIQNRYFCSQFVAELLATSGAVQLPKKPSLYLPDDLMGVSELKLCYRGELSGLEELIW